MIKKTIQFHCLPKEIARFVNDCILEFNLHSFIISKDINFKQGKIERVVIIDEAIAMANSIQSIYLLATLPSMKISSERDLIRQCLDFICIQLGRMSNDSLSESIMQVVSDNPKIVNLWKGVINKLKKATHCGAWVTNPNTHSRCFMKNHRYFDGAKDLQQAGIKMIPIVGWNLYQLQ